MAFRRLFEEDRERHLVRRRCKDELHQDARSVLEILPNSALSTMWLDLQNSL